jgi:hypothetical protein
MNILVHFVSIWYISSGFGIMYQKNLATLGLCRLVHFPGIGAAVGVVLLKKIGQDEERIFPSAVAKKQKLFAHFFSFFRHKQIGTH